MLKTVQREFAKIKPQHHLILLAGIIIILLAIFWPRTQNLFSAGLSAHIGNIGGKIEVEAFDPAQDKAAQNQAAQDKAVVLFYAPWCGHCKKLMPTWERLMENKLNYGVSLALVNCDDKPELAKQHNIEGFPTIKYLPYGMKSVEGSQVYDGPRDYDSIHNFISKLN